MAYDPTSIVVVGIVLPLIALAAVCLRFWVRLRVQPTYLGADDWLALGAVIFSMIDGANMATAAIVGTQGRIYDGNPPEDRHTAEAKSDYAQAALEKPFYTLVKLSVLYFYRRVFFPQKRFLLFNNLMIALVILWGVAYTFAEIFVCGGNPAAIWDPTAGPATCVNETWLDFSYAITDAIGDLLVISMPYPCIKKLQMSTREKVGIAMIFMLGTLSTVASFIRLGYVSVAFTQDFGPDGDPHGSGTTAEVWGSVEGSVGVLAACLPPLGPLITRLPSMKQIITSSKHSNAGPSRTQKAPTNLVDRSEKLETARPSEAESRKHSHGEEPAAFV